MIVFRSFTKPDLIEILESGSRQGDASGCGTKNLRLELDDKAKDFLVEKGYDPQYGARPMRRAVERFLEDPLAEEILKGKLHEGEPIIGHRRGRQAGVQPDSRRRGRAVELTFRRRTRIISNRRG